MKIMLALCLATVSCAGSDGMDGSNGRDGKSPELSAVEADRDECPAGGWVIDADGDELVLCNGEDGPEGPAGADGEQGPLGEPAEPGIGVIEGSVYCSDTVPDTALVAQYSARFFTDGTVWAHAEIGDEFASYSSTVLYAPGQSGSETGQVTVGYDPAGEFTRAFWVLWVSTDPLEFVVEFHDAELDPPVTVWSMPVSECLVVGL